MTDYRLTYFDMEGGRAQPVRIALHAAGIQYEDRRLSFPEFGAACGEFRFGCVPVLEVDGQQVTQSNAQARYAGKKAGMYPEDDLQALYCDEVLGAVEDCVHRIGPTMRMEGEELRKAREFLVNERLPIMIKGLDELLKRGGGQYFADNKLTVADLKVADLVGWLGSGMLDHIPQDFVQNISAALVEHLGRIMQEPPVAAYYASRQ